TRAARRVRSPPSISALPLAPQGKGVEGDGVEAGGLQLAQVAVVVGAGGGEHLPVMFAEAAQGLVPVEIEQPRQGKYLAAALILVRGVAHRAVAEGARAVIEPLVDEGEGGGEGVVLALDGQAEVGPGAVEIVHGSVPWEGAAKAIRRRRRCHGGRVRGGADRVHWPHSVPRPRQCCSTVTWGNGPARWTTAPTRRSCPISISPTSPAACTPADPSPCAEPWPWPGTTGSPSAPTRATPTPPTRGGYRCPTRRRR